jgi:hypothetical protein
MLVVEVLSVVVFTLVEVVLSIGDLEWCVCSGIAYSF